MLSLVMATAWLFIKREYLLEYFYFSQLLGLTHLLTLGVLSSLMMGRPPPLEFDVAPRRSVIVLGRARSGPGQK